MNSTLIYQKRINLAVDFFSVHYAEQINLAQAASVAGFSPYHFHRLFSAIIGETPANYLQRIRLEMAANLLRKSTRTIAQIACDCGFSSPAVFSRLFGKTYGYSPRYYRTTPDANLPGYGSLPMQSVSADFQLRPLQIRFIDEQRVFYLASYEGYRADVICSIWEKLSVWLALRSWVTPDCHAYGMSLDDPCITQPNRCRYYACLTVPAAARASHPVSEMTIPSGEYAIFESTCRAEEIKAVYASIYRDWLPGSGYEPANCFPFEEYIIRPEQHPRGLYELKVFIPVVPLQM
jgi:AraC family transcriptional regulator